MEENNAKSDESETVARNVSKDSFRMYYALGPEVEQINSMDFLDSHAEDSKDIYLHQDTSDFEEDSDEHVIKETYRGKVEEVRKVINDGELSDDSGTADEKEWKGSSVPPDIVASANHFKVIREEPKRSKVEANIATEPLEQDITDFRRLQVEAYTNLEDLLDEPWEESDFAPPSKVDVVLRVGGELGERYSNV